jgi:hypothetical protein
MTMQDDLANRAAEIHWPTGFDPAKADLFSHNELVINAPCERVWQHIIDATKWPEWYPNSKDVRITDGTVLAEDTLFRWTTFGLPLESKINEFVPYTRIGWYGCAPGTTPRVGRVWGGRLEAGPCVLRRWTERRRARGLALRQAQRLSPDSSAALQLPGLPAGTVRRHPSSSKIRTSLRLRPSSTRTCSRAAFALAWRSTTSVTPTPEITVNFMARSPKCTMDVGRLPTEGPHQARGDVVLRRLTPVPFNRFAPTPASTCSPSQGKKGNC